METVFDSWSHKFFSIIRDGAGGLNLDLFVGNTRKCQLSYETLDYIFPLEIWNSFRWHIQTRIFLFFSEKNPNKKFKRHKFQLQIQRKYYQIAEPTIYPVTLFMNYFFGILSQLSFAIQIQDKFLIVLSLSFVFAARFTSWCVSNGILLSSIVFLVIILYHSS